MSRVGQLVLVCEICQSKSLADYDLLYKLGDYDVIRCKNCRLVFVNEIFNESRHADGRVYAEEVYERVGPTLLKRFTVDLHAIESLVPRGDILDVGSGYGYFLSVAQSRGWNAVGVEINRNLVSYVKREKGLHLYAGRLEEIQFPKESFDVITMFNIIEHFLHPSMVLGEVSRLLRYPGLLVIETPTEDGLFKKLADLLYKMTQQKFTLMIRGAYQKGGHHFGFSRTSIRKMLSKHEFEVIKIEGRMSPFKEFISKELLEGPLHIKVIKLFAVPSLWVLSWILKLENRMVVYARKRQRLDKIPNTEEL